MRSHWSSGAVVEQLFPDRVVGVGKRSRGKVNRERKGEEVKYRKPTARLQPPQGMCSLQLLRPFKVARRMGEEDLFVYYAAGGDRSVQRVQSFSGYAPAERGPKTRVHELWSAPRLGQWQVGLLSSGGFQLRTGSLASICIPEPQGSARHCRTGRAVSQRMYLGGI